MPAKSSEIAVREALSGLGVDLPPSGIDRGESAFEGNVSRLADYDEFHGETEAQIEIKREKPEHRLMIMFFAQGMSVKDVFIQFGGEWSDEKGNCGPIHGTGKYSYAHISQVRKQPWAQESIARIMRETIQDPMAARFAELGSRAVDVLEEVMTSEKTAPNVRANAANSILDRHLGRAVQKIETKSDTTVRSLTMEASELQKELEEIEAQIKNHNAAS